MKGSAKKADSTGQAETSRNNDPVTLTDTIAAVATPPGRGGIAVLRVSGPGSRDIAVALADGVPSPRHATLTDFRAADGNVIDRGLLIWFPAPHSYTGEDVLELQGHGSPVILDMLLQRVLSLGARVARPGEFTERAYLNDRMDLAQAEAVADLIDAGSQQAATAALHSLQGAFSSQVHALVEQLTQLRVHVEAAMDFPEEEIDFLADPAILTALDSARRQLDAAIDEAGQGVVLREGLTLVIVGEPNVGKSSLLNALAGEDRAIVTEIAGTTRDVLRAEISVDGLPLHVIDTAGLRDSDDPVEQEGIRRARAEMQRADHLLVVVDDRNPKPPALAEELMAKLPHSWVHNKCDLSGGELGLRDEGRTLGLSALSGAGLDELRTQLCRIAGLRSDGAGRFTARRRHLDALQRAAASMTEARRQLVDVAAGELAAQDLLAAQNALAEITGEFGSDDLLGEIFGSFCIGK